MSENGKAAKHRLLVPKEFSEDIPLRDKIVRRFYGEPHQYYGDGVRQFDADSLREIEKLMEVSIEGIMGDESVLYLEPEDEKAVAGMIHADLDVQISKALVRDMETGEETERVIDYVVNLTESMSFYLGKEEGLEGLDLEVEDEEWHEVEIRRPSCEGRTHGPQLSKFEDDDTAKEEYPEDGW